MNSLGLLDTRPDRILTTDDASYLALESGFDPVVNDQASFDIYPDQKPKDPSNLPIRPPIVCIMGHVDHGKTTLLDSLRSTSIADLEAGGITQHIGAFEVSIKDLIKNFNKDSDNENNSAITTQSGSAATITFLDTPGHAAFSSMRSRGAMITDVAVIVVAGDDGVKTQTKEVIDLVRQSDVGIVVAITKCDKPGINLHRTRASIYEAGIEIESLGGEVPCVEVSALTGKGLAELAETIVTVAEFRDLRAETGNVRFEGRVIESDVGRGLGNVATVISLRGKLRVGLDIIAGQSYGRVRQLISVNGQSLESVMPGQPVQVTGWKNLPEAGSLVLGADSEDDAKRACENRIRRQKDQQLIQEIEVVNEKRALAKETFENNKSELEGLDRRSRIALIRDREKRELAESSERSKDLAKNPKELRLIIKSDYTGTVEAVKAAIESLDNQQVKVKIVSSGVGSITESDVGMAVATKGMIVGFNVKIDKGAYLMIGTHKVECKTETVIYRLIELVTNKLVEMLPKRYEERVIGEALISEIFEVSFKEAGKNKKKRVGGCKVVNGEIRRNNKVKVIRGQETIWKGFLEQLKHGKKDIKTSISKGTDCGLSFGDGDDQGLGLSRFEDRFEGFEVNDRVLSIEEVAIKRSLNDGL
ncbi:P-loop containing nucleoside triphosphate hydrolase protein [Phakopsora pachyrhizi]|uniref:P-loop containing nucleoside triphosphate hydrolase protein n=1 Tax=Phakopsora pachyrhizi TaxID=170000 RepID=A0AAV0B8N9_PHAPC|nr:P-loop containing nucleoside triphosphate hydrolase protein [Phakopsora pachyrhizi]CAH7674863.1 P-loop containing nucleoside triphosphate hydrolase protein [Phakopsora pachyrhizi]CAH7683479.1 P-loop containing nucleoside triphosphate hydrolase protein [Phakopsora pachyrhizi]